ncbi:hypothetical protein [Paenibacillus sp. IHBB 10380]|uniref:hypothetical protein n=1 Tax=Paenibacillus sp. IHBB 10380 TaxID=1566358 RepID=UPI000B2E3445|nr:hypothetical protein [Paenibacillus sp. IHBB 10380]
MDWHLKKRWNWVVAKKLNLYQDKHWSWTVSLYSGFALIIWITVQLDEIILEL